MYPKLRQFSIHFSLFARIRIVAFDEIKFLLTVLSTIVYNFQTAK